MYEDEFGRQTSGITLEACTQELRRRCEAVARLQGGRAHYLEQLEIFRQYAEEFRLFLSAEPAISGTPASYEQIRDFFTNEGWLHFRVEGELAFFDPIREVAISDTHRGNIILMEDGLLAPIDLRVEHLSGSLLDTVKRLCSHSPT